MIMVNNPFGSDELDITEEDAASRIGRRIRKIREARGMSQSQLGELVGLNADRIQKYENGARKPKSDLLKKIASVLGVSSLAIADPTTSSYVNAMFAMFELEENFDMVIKKEDGARISLTCGSNSGIGKYMMEWYEAYSNMVQQSEVATSEEERDELVAAYHNWEWTFPQGIVDKTEKALMKVRIRNKIEELQGALEKLEEDDE